jgi:hypothetical protein
VGIEGKFTVERLCVLGTADCSITILKELLLFHTPNRTKCEIVFKFLFRAFAGAVI